MSRLSPTVHQYQGSRVHAGRKGLVRQPCRQETPGVGTGFAAPIHVAEDPASLSTWFGSPVWTRSKCRLTVQLTGTSNIPALALCKALRNSAGKEKPQYQATVGRSDKPRAVLSCCGFDGAVPERQLPLLHGHDLYTESRAAIGPKRDEHILSALRLPSICGDFAHSHRLCRVIAVLSELSYRCSSLGGNMFVSHGTLLEVP
ncbi:hypothetical protein M8818_006218 [Zalaria obscura]|uniref:Uncharacterized protein n=1 Tax=Zalaria obscura TaxID=2024903 RepID=A0ACC3S7W7_9PEZI